MCCHHTWHRVYVISKTTISFVLSYSICFQVLGWGLSRLLYSRSIEYKKDMLTCTETGHGLQRGRRYRKPQLLQSHGTRMEISHFDTESARTSVWNCNISLICSEWNSLFTCMYRSLYIWQPNYHLWARSPTLDRWKQSQRVKIEEGAGWITGRLPHRLNLQTKTWKHLKMKVFLKKINLSG